MLHEFFLDGPMGANKTIPHNPHFRLQYPYEGFNIYFQLSRLTLNGKNRTLTTARSRKTGRTSQPTAPLTRKMTANRDLVGLLMLSGIDGHWLVSFPLTL